MINDDYPHGVEAMNPDSFDDVQCDRCFCLTATVVDADGNEQAADIIVPFRQPESSYAYMHEGDSIGDAQYGLVYRCQVLKRIVERHDGGSIWQKTAKVCAIKETDIQDLLDNPTSQSPIQELCAMQHLKRLHEADLVNQARQQGITQLSQEELRARYEETILDTNVMMPLDTLTDGTTIFCIMPFCEGRDLFCNMDEEGFSEDEARDLVVQILNGLETLQRAGICHRDISPENIMIDDRGRPIIIDFGYSLKIPHIGNERSLMTRRLLNPCGRQGKTYYMSPEICNNSRPFDGHAVDLWALGPIIHTLCTGETLWEIPLRIWNHRFDLASQGEFARVAQDFESKNEAYHLSEDLVDLLQGMFNYDADGRLSLAQMRSHAWMQGPAVAPAVIRNDE